MRLKKHVIHVVPFIHCKKFIYFLKFIYLFIYLFIWLFVFIYMLICLFIYYLLWLFDVFSCYVLSNIQESNERLLYLALCWQNHIYISTRHLILEIHRCILYWIRCIVCYIYVSSKWMDVNPPGGALTLEGDMGTCCPQDPLFQAKF